MENNVISFFIVELSTLSMIDVMSYFGKNLLNLLIEWNNMINLVF